MEPIKRRKKKVFVQEDKKNKKYYEYRKKNTELARKWRQEKKIIKNLKSLYLQNLKELSKIKYELLDLLLEQEYYLKLIIK